MVGIIHTPRTLFFLGRGLVRKQRGADPTGFGHKNPFVTEGRAGLFDCDYQLHLNNAAYLSYAEYARWEVCAYNGMLQAMFREKMAFVVGGTTVRYRREIRPLFRKFEVHSYLARLDERNMWIYHAFRYPTDGKDPGRIRAQVLCQGLAVKNKEVLDPRKFLIESVGIDKDTVDELSHNSDDKTMTELIEKYADMEEVLKRATTEDDEWLTTSTRK